MEHAVENLGTISTHALEELRRSIEKVVDVEQTYVSEESIEGLTMTFLLKEDYLATSVEIINDIGEIMKVFPDVRYRIYGHSYAAKELENANLYFIKNCKLGKVIYNKSNLESFHSQEKDEIESLLKKATKRIAGETERINSFTEGIKFYRKRKEWAGAAFLIHQKLEWLYRYMETFAMGKPLICHKIKNHLTYAHPFIHGAGPIINTERRDELQLLEVLDRSYIESRYNSAFDITKREVKILHERAELMENQVKEIFQFRMDDCLKLLSGKKERIPVDPKKRDEKEQNEKEDEDMTFLKEIIPQELEAVKIISFGKRTGCRERQSLSGIPNIHSFIHFDLVIITKEKIDIYPSKISNLISQETDGKLTTTILICSSKKIEQALKKGNEFVHNVLKSGTVIYSDPEISLDIPPFSPDLKEKLRKVREEFFIRNHRATCFLAAADIVSGDDDATEISLQYMALQQICLGTIYVMLGLRPDCLKLEHLLNLCSNFSNLPDDCFPRWSREDQRLFKKLINSPHEVRFRTSDRRSLVDVDILLSRSQTFLKEMETITEKRIEELEKELKQQDHEN